VQEEMSKVLFNKETKVWEGPKVPYEFDSATSIGAELLKSLELTPERVLHICHDDDSSMTCEQTKISSIRISQNLMKLGFKRDDVFGFICRNSTQLPAAIYGSILIGAPINPLDVAFKKEDIVQMFTQTQPKLVFCDADVYEKTKLALDELENKPKIVTLRDKIDGVSYIEDLLATTGNEHEFV
jgi:4-coumarate--CoA ligase